MARMNDTKTPPAVVADGGNPFFETWTGPFGVPPFARLRPEHFAPAYERAFAEHLAEIEAIAADPAPPTFENTIAALENSGRALQRVDDTFGHLTGADSNDALLEIEREMSPRVAAHWAKVRMNEAVFARIDALFQKRHGLSLSAEQARVLERYHTGRRRSGAALDPASRQRLAEITERLVALGTAFSQNYVCLERA